MRSRSIAIVLALVGVLTCVPAAHAQRRGFGGFGFRSAPIGRGFARSHGARRAYAATAFLPYLYSDYYGDYGPNVVEVPVPEHVPAVQPAPPASPRPAAESLLLESQGDHWVRITNYGQSQSGGESSVPKGLTSAIFSGTTRSKDANESPTELPPAVLVFRDGHQEQIGKYAIVGPTIYASSDYWTSGAWTRKFQIAELDVPATLKLNQERGTRFSLPSRPNEVMVRP